MSGGTLLCDFEGNNSIVGAVLGLKSEKVDTKLPFDAFQAKMSDFIVVEMVGGRDVVPIVKIMVDPTAILDRKSPEDLEGSDLSNQTKVSMHNERLKMFVKRELKLEENVEKVFSLIWGLCSHGLQEIILTNEDFEGKEESSDVIWLVDRLKMVSSGIDTRRNKHKNLFEAMMRFLNICQGELKTNDAYLRRFKAEAQTVELFYSTVKLL